MEKIQNSKTIICPVKFISNQNMFYQDLSDLKAIKY